MTEHPHELAISERQLPGLTFMEGLIEKVSTGSADIEVLERLLALKEKEDTRKAEAALIKALHDFQAKCPSVVKQVKVHTKAGQLAYKYATFEQVKRAITPALMDCGLMFSHTVEEKCVVCRVSHRAGAFVESSFPLTAWEGTQMQNSTQKMASAISYAKRYSLLGALGIATTDDDDAGSITDPATLDDLKHLYSAWCGKNRGVDDAQLGASFRSWAKDKVFSREMTDEELRDHKNWTKQDVQRGHEFLERVTFDDFAPPQTRSAVELLDEINTSDNPEHIRLQLTRADESKSALGDQYEAIQRAGKDRLKKLSDGFSLKG